MDNVNILSEQHDITQINVGDFTGSIQQQIDRLRNGGGGWDALEYGLTREEQIARLEAANTPEAQARELEALKQRAIGRASLDVSTGKVALVTAGKLPWHGLGVNVKSAMTWSQAAELGRLNWEVNKRPLQYTGPKGSFDVKGNFALVRSDTGRVFDVVKDYKPIQNHEAFSFLDDVLQQHGAHYEVAGSIFGGEQIFLVVKMPNQSFMVDGKDQQDAYVVFTNPHVCGKSAKCFATSVRPECANTLRVAMAGMSRGISIRHTGNLKQKIQDAQRALGLAVTGFDAYRNACEQMVSTDIKITPFANSVLDEVLDISAADLLLGPDALAATISKDDKEHQANVALFTKQIERRNEIMDDILDCYDSDHNAKRGTVWGAFNAITDHVDHNRVGKQARDAETWRSRRFETALFGKGDLMKQVAFRLALAQ